MITLRPTTMDDLGNIMSWVNDHDVVANIANIKGVTVEQERQWLQKTLASKEDRLYSAFDAAGNYVGQAGLHKIYWPARNARMSIIVKREFQDCSVGSQMILSLLEEAFVDLNLHKVWCVVWEDNPKTVHLYRDKIGMIEEGRLIDEYFLDGKHHNMLRLYMLQSHWA